MTGKELQDLLIKAFRDYRSISLAGKDCIVVSCQIDEAYGIKLKWCAALRSLDGSAAISLTGFVDDTPHPWGDAIHHVEGE